ncbi:hypothetical protein F5Y09DRAFT_353465 [Xylaria sp. FL1042]|nr:hypothetical protein F5Y09DRAFT_353465 [Xylaria sp. FL1042]
MILLSLIVVASLVLGQDNRPADPNNHFIYPPLPGPQFSNDPTVFGSNLAFTVGSPQSQPFKWVSNMSSMRIYLQQEGNQLSVQQHLLTDCQSGTNNFIYWDGNIGDIDLKNGTQAYLSAYNCSNPGSTPVFFSHYINLTEPVKSNSATSTVTDTVTDVTVTATSLALLTTMSTDSLAVPTSTGTNEASSPSSSSSSSSPSSSINASDMAGGIGGGIAGAIVLAIIIFAFLKTRKARNEAEQAQDQGAPASSWVQQENPKPKHPTSHMSYAPESHASEMDSSHDSVRFHSAGYTSVISELPSDTAGGR